MLSAYSKLDILKRLEVKQASIASLAREYNVARGTIYKCLVDSKNSKSPEPKPTLFDKKVYKILIRLVCKSPKFTSEQYSTHLREMNFHISSFDVQNYLNKLGLTDEYTRLNYCRNYLGPGRFKPDVKKEIVTKCLQDSRNVSELARNYNVSRNIIYKWVKDYQSNIEYLDKYRRGDDHHKAVYPRIEEEVLSMVVNNPNLTAKQIAGIVQVSSWTIWKIMDRNNLNKMSNRMAYSVSHRTEPVAATESQVIDRDRSITEQFVPNVAPAPPLKRSKLWLYFILSSYFSLFIFLTIFKILPIINSVGMMFAGISLIMGSFFFLYSLKYYLTLAIVLSYSQQDLKKKNIKESIRGSLLNWLLGNKNLNDSKILGLESNLDNIVLINKPFVSVHVALYNEKNVVERLSQALTSFDYPNYEIILADDSTDETSELIKNYQKRYLFKEESLTVTNGDGWEMTEIEVKPGVTFKHLHRNTRSGYKGQALKLALSLSDPKTEKIAVFDADFVPYPDTLTLFLKYFQTQNDPKTAVVQGYQWHVLNKSENWITRGVRSEYAGSYIVERSGIEIYGGLKQVSGSVYMIRRDALESVGWGSSITEDFELTLKLYEKGFKVLYTPYIQAPAECVSTLNRLIRQRMRWAEGHSFNVKKMFFKLLFSNHLSIFEKFELIYLTPYYLQALFFLIGTFSWLVSEAIFKVRLPFWTELWGWSLVLTNMISLPLTNAVGLFLEESEHKDYSGLGSFIALSYLVAPFQAYSAVKGFIQSHEGPWFRTPKTGRITDTFIRGKFYRFIQGIIPNKIPALDMNFLELKTAHNTFDSFSIKPKMNRYVGNLVLLVLLVSSVTISYLGMSVKTGSISDLPVQVRVERMGEENHSMASLFKSFTPRDALASAEVVQKVVVSGVSQVSMETLKIILLLIVVFTVFVLIYFARRNKRTFKKVFKIVIISSLIASWLLSGFPIIWNKPRFPPRIGETLAALPTFVACGTQFASVNAVSAPLPSGLTTNDILLLFIETDAQAITVSDSAGGTWTEVTNSPQSVTGTRLTVFWSRYNGTQTAPTVSDSGNHQIGAICAWTGIETSGNPWDVTSGNTDSSSDTSGAEPGASTSGADRLVVIVGTADIDTALPITSISNGNLANISAARITASSTVGNDGGLSIFDGQKATAGNYGNTILTYTGNTLKGMMSIALRSPTATSQTSHRFRTDDGSETTATWKDDENTDAYYVGPTEIIRLRIEAHSTVSMTLNARLEYSTDATNCNNGTWTALDTSTTAWRVTNSSNITNDDATTNQLTTSNKTFTAGNIFDTQNEDTTGVALNETQSEWEWAIQGTGSFQSTVYRFRISDAGTALSSYDNCPLIVTATTGGYHQPYYRIRSDDTLTLNDTVGWAADLNTYATMDAGKRFRIRFEVEQPNGTGSSTSWKLQYRFRTSTGLWGSWADSPDRAEAGYDGPLQVLDSNQYADGDAANQNILAGSAETFDTGGTGEENRTTGAITISNEHAEYEFTIMILGTWGGPNRMKDNNQLEFRLSESAGTLFTGIMMNPRITVNMPDYFLSPSMMETTGRAGPFKDTNGNLYFMIEPTYIAGTGNNEPEMLKSTDGGKNWDLVGTSGSPTVNDLEGVDVFQSGDTLHICVQEGTGSLNVTYHTFRLSDHSTNSDTWGIVDEAVVTPGTAPANQTCGIIKRSDGTVVVFYRYSDGTNQRVGYKIRPSSGPPWGTQVNLDTTASTNFVYSGAVLGASDKTHIFYKDDTNEDVLYKSLTSADSLSGSPTTIESDAQATTNSWATTPAVYWTEEGTGNEKIMLGVMDNSDSILYSVTLTNGTPGARKQISATGIRHSPTGTSSNQPVADLVVDSVTDKQYSIFSPTNDADLDYDAAINDGGWTTDTNLLDQLTLEYLKGQLFTHSSGNGGNKVYGYWYESTSGGDSGFSWYGEKVITTFNQSAYRFFQNLDSTSIGPDLAAQDTAADMTADGQVIRLRFLLHVGGNQFDGTGDDFKIQIAERSGTCDTAFSGETYADLSPSAGVIRFYDNPTPTDGSSMTPTGSDPTHSGHTINFQTYEESNNFTGINSIAAGNDGKWDITIVDNSASNGVAYCVRVITSGGGLLDTYTVIPEFTTVPENPFLLLGLYPILKKFASRFKKKKKIIV